MPESTNLTPITIREHPHILNFQKELAYQNNQNPNLLKKIGAIVLVILAKVALLFNSHTACKKLLNKAFYLSPITAFNCMKILKMYQNKTLSPQNSQNNNTHPTPPAPTDPVNITLNTAPPLEIPLYPLTENAEHADSQKKTNDLPNSDPNVEKTPHKATPQNIEDTLPLSAPPPLNTTPTPPPIKKPFVPADDGIYGLGDTPCWATPQDPPLNTTPTPPPIIKPFVPADDWVYGLGETSWWATPQHLPLKTPPPPPPLFPKFPLADAQLYAASFIIPEFQKKLLHGKFGSIPFSSQDLSDMLNKWNKLSNNYKSNEIKSKFFNCLLNETMKDLGLMKQHMAHMHAEGLSEQYPWLKEMKFGSKKMAGPYLLHFLKQNQERLGLKKFTEHLASCLETDQDNSLKFDDLAHRYSDKELETQRTNQLRYEAKAHLRETQALAPGQQKIFLANVYLPQGGHALSYVIRKQQNGLYQFIVVDSNGHNIKLVDSKGHNIKLVDSKGQIINPKGRRNPFLTISDIPVKNICTLEFFMLLVGTTRKIYGVQSFSSFYQLFIKNLQGKLTLILASTKGQRGSGSCAWSFFPELLKLNCIGNPNKNHYKKSIFIIKAQSMIEYYHLAKDHFDKDFQAKELMEIAISEYTKRVEKMKKLVGNDELETWLTQEEKDKIAYILNTFQ